MNKRLLFFAASACALAAAFACSSSSSRDPAFDDQNATVPSASAAPAAPPGGFKDAAAPDAEPELARDPETCDEAKSTHSYVGCDYWPTVTGNVVHSVFDFAVVVANTNKTTADVKVTGPNGVDQSTTIAPGTLAKIYLPWVASLKGPDEGTLGVIPMTASVAAVGGAYHLVSSVPVVVYQFNALEYKGEGGPPGKDWSDCPVGRCFSYTNDASLLMPSTAWTTSYRVMGIHGWTMTSFASPPEYLGTNMAITAAEDATNVNISLTPRSAVLAGDGIPARDGGTALTLSLDKGDVVELVTPKGAQYDFSGSLVVSDKPIQIITGIPCIYLPENYFACDHVEESVMPAEALGKQYVVVSPTPPKGGSGIHIIRFVGNRDGTTLTYTPVRPPTCPATLNAGEVEECGPIDIDFVVEGNEEFGVMTFQVGAQRIDPNDPRGDPSESIFASTEQYRTNYLFLAPDDYDVSYAVITGPQSAKPKIDGVALTGYVGIGKGVGVWRPTLGAGNGGAHTLTADKPVGLQVMGYGSYTSYQYPGGLNLKAIAPPPTTH
jgi:hypothetical protein